MNFRVEGDTKNGETKMCIPGKGKRTKGEFQETKVRVRGVSRRGLVE